MQGGITTLPSLIVGGGAITVEGGAFFKFLQLGGWEQLGRVGKYKTKSFGKVIKICLPQTIVWGWGWKQLVGVRKYKKESGKLVEICTDLKKLGEFWENN